MRGITSLLGTFRIEVRRPISNFKAFMLLQTQQRKKADSFER